jgi:predicted ATP-dependent serine protease
MNALVTASLAMGDVHLLFSFPRELVSNYERKILTWIVDYTSRYGAPPTVERVETQFPSFTSVKSKDPLGDIYDQTLVRKRNVFVREYLTTIQEELKSGVDPLPHIEELHRAIAGGNGDVTKYTTYDRTAYHRTPTTFPYGIPQIDQYTGGIAQGDLVYLIGRLGTGKTTFAIWMLTKWLQAGKRILMVSNENRADDVVAKIDSYIGGFNPLKKRTLGWTPEDVARIETVSFIARHMEGEVYIPNRPVSDVSEVRSLIYSNRPDLVIIDGIYLMRGASGDSHWEKITSISRELKQVAEGEGLPVMGIHQANRNAIGRRIEVEHVAYADALAQDADLLLAINPEEEGDSLFVESIKNRWGKKNFGFFMRFFFDSMTVKVMDAKYATEEEE